MSAPRASTAAPDGMRASRPHRIAALDAARALGVVAMVLGHTLDALLAPVVRASPAAVAYWKARGLTAPLFLLVAGWAVAAAIGRGGARGLAIPAGRLGRVLLLLVVAYALRWPGWGVNLLAARDADTWAHLLAFDALHTIAVALLAAALVLALPWSRREQALFLALLAVLAVALGMRAPGALPAGPLALAFAQAAGGTSPFPLFPWAGYFFAGAIVGLLSRDDRGGRSGIAMGAVGGALLLATFWTGVGTMPPGHPVLFLFRIGAVLLVLAALTFVPAAAASRLAPLGRASLGVYGIHVVIVYGWSSYEGLARRIGPVLSAGEALGVAALVLAASLALHRVARAALGLLAAAARRAWVGGAALAAPIAVALRGRRAD